MNQKSILGAVLAFVFCFITVTAQNQKDINASSPQNSKNDIITLTVSSDGPTKEDAVKNALRSAIEQAYGAFVSANTTILNDEVVKDEIVTLSNGSIKEYKEISAVQADNGSFMVSLSATVSLPHLIKYAKSHGSECEFAGNTFGMEMKLFELQSDNERKVLENLLKLIEIMIPRVMSWELKLSEPTIHGDKCKFEGGIYYGGTSDIDYESILKANKLPIDILDYDNNALNELNLNDKQRRLIDKLKYDRRNNKHHYNEIDLLIYNTLYKMKTLDDKSAEIWRNRGYKLGGISAVRCYRRHDFGLDEDRYWRKFKIRNVENSNYFNRSLDSLLKTDAINFVIKDNTGQISDLNLLRSKDLQEFKWNKNDTIFRNVIECRFANTEIYYPVIMKGTGLFSPQYKFRYVLDRRYSFDSRCMNRLPLITFELMIPKSEISKYSKFWIERKE